MEKIGFIGMGNMAQALVSGFRKAGIKTGDIFAYAPNQEKLLENSKKFGFVPCDSVQGLVDSVDTVFMACKPHQIEGVLEKIKERLDGKVLVSIALGWNFKKYESVLNPILDSIKNFVGRGERKKCRVQFVMPNTPAMAGEGVFLFEKSNSLEEGERRELWELFSKMGVVEELPDNLMGIGGAVAGCGPAFVDVFIESYADAAVKYGIPRAAAYRLVSQMVLGSARLQLETGTHPGELKDAVCSPGGSTIRGVAALDEFGFRKSCMKSIDAIMEM